MNPKKALSIYILSAFLFFFVGCVPAVESVSDATHPETESASEDMNTDTNVSSDSDADTGSDVGSTMKSSTISDIVFFGWEDFPIVFSGGDETIDFGMSEAEVASRLGKVEVLGGGRGLFVAPENNVLCAGWRVTDEQYIFSEEGVLCYIDTGLEFVGKDERPDALRSRLEESLGLPDYAGGVKWDGELEEWAEFSAGIDDVNIPAYFESEWTKDGDKVLSYRQFGSQLIVYQAVSEYPSDNILADLRELAFMGGHGIEYPTDNLAAGVTPGLIDPDTELHMGDLVLGMDEDAFWKALGGGPISEQVIQPADDVVDTALRECRFDGGRALFVDRPGQSSTLYSITVESPKFQTYRGLSPLDTVIRLIELYGLPYGLTGDIWSYGDGGYELYQIAVRRGVVQSINLHYSM
jgi:hypothetical protein